MPRRFMKTQYKLTQAFPCRLSPVVPFTNHIAKLLRSIYVDPPYKIKTEWRPMLREEVRFGSARARRIMYSPAIDLAVGPFATHRPLVEEYDQMVTSSTDMLFEMLRSFARNLGRFQSRFPPPRFDQLASLNPNARCFLAIEIEKGNRSVKYLMGSTLNASSLGRIGIVVAWDQPRLDDLLREREYLSNLETAGKNSFNTGNSLFLRRHQLTRIIARHARGVQRNTRQ